ncbi:hypothetical protein BTA51_29515 [Hahella sp. CCB-MM4]|uniref:DUF3775 domain-containing protein n=1 Tax=Hahella sp. (strain CCB-MM4) TaxID=1926491 RepID=UPI000B9BB4DC|nr:DUF3775 domain-containing protein [Hahella sp. CCB-MM4]OZG69764.1 hypothetical protein BTA51_29515 [Hahella sp. CCB-MM4]
MLDINPEIIRRLIQLAQEFHAKEGVVFPDDTPDSSDDWAMQVLADHSGDQSVREFQSIISDLDPDQQQEVVALMWLGRNDFDLEEWKQALTEAEENWSGNTAEYLLAHPMLADHLSEGLYIHGYDGD